MAQVACAGILVADTFCGPLDGMPQPGELLALESMPSKAGGCAANVAIGLSKQGIQADVAGCLGNDPAAEVVLRALQTLGIGTGHIHRVAEPTSQTIVLLERGQDRRYLHVFGANKCLSAAHIPWDWLETVQVFYLGGLFVLPGLELGALRETLEFCRANKVVTVVDVVIPRTQQDFQGLGQILPLVDYFLPNQDEAWRITGQMAVEAQVCELLAVGVGTAIVTCGASGVVAQDRHHRWQVDAFPVEALDMSGSGDGFAAGVITGIIRGWDMPKLLAYASALGASTTRAIGTTDGVFTASEAELFLGQHKANIRVSSQTHEH